MCFGVRAILTQLSLSSGFLLVAKCVLGRQFACSNQFCCLFISNRALAVVVHKPAPQSYRGVNQNVSEQHQMWLICYESERKFKALRFCQCVIYIDIIFHPSKSKTWPHFSCWALPTVKFLYNDKRVERLLFFSSTRGRFANFETFGDQTPSESHRVEVSCCWSRVSFIEKNRAINSMHDNTLMALILSAWLKANTRRFPCDIASQAVCEIFARPRGWLFRARGVFCNSNENEQNKNWW